MPGVLILAVLILGAGVELVAAQIPLVCANNADLQSGRCCPDNCGGSARGECEDVSTMCKTDYSSMGLPAHFTNDGRFNWPSQSSLKYVSARATMVDMTAQSASLVIKDKTVLQKPCEFASQ